MLRILVTLLLSTLLLAAQAADDKMLYVEYRLAGKQIAANSFDAQIKKVWRIGNEYLRFEDAPYIPGVLDKIISEARRDRAEYGFAQLRLVLCFLRWNNLKEAPDERIDSPLLLLPVRLTRRKRVHSILNTLHQWESDVNALRGAISRIRVRSLLIWGTRDTAVDLKSSEALMHVLPHCKRALIQGAGHLPFEETPDEFNRVVLDFLATAPPLADRAPD